MISQRDKGDLARFYTVTDPRRHQKGFTIYKVTARIVSRKNPEEVQEIIAWKRYSDFKKLHRDLWQIHNTIFRQTELFPPFAKAKLFGRFDESVIEERRQCAEDLLQFSANIPALYNSSHLEDFFKDGEVHDGSDLIGPAESYSDYCTDSLSDCSSDVRKDSCGFDDLTFASQSECGVDVDSLSGLDDGMASNQTSPSKPFGVPPTKEAMTPSFSASGHEGAEAERESRSLFPAKLKQNLGRADYLVKAGELINMAMKKETEQDFEAAFGFYRKGVDLLLEGVQGESSPTRREAVKKKTAEYLMRAENISLLCFQPSADDNVFNNPPGARSSRPTRNLRSPAEELKVFRVLGVIYKVLLVLDTRSQETFILKGLRKSSEVCGSKKTITPRCVPNMVSLHKYIISEESLFLVLQYAEGGKLWSCLSKFFSRSTEGSFDVLVSKSSNSDEDLMKCIAVCPKNSMESRGSSSHNLLSVQPLDGSLTFSSQDDSSTQEEGRESPLKWVDSASSSEEECTTSYLTLCNEYGKEKIENEVLSEEPLLRLEGNDDDAKDLTVFNSLSSQATCHELKLFNEESEFAVDRPMSDSLSKSRNSPMEFFRIDSRDSTSDILGSEFVDKVFGLKSETLNPFSSLQDDEVEVIGENRDIDKPPIHTHDTISRGSNDSMPVISFKDAAIDDFNIIDEGRPDLLVNLPGSEQVEETPITFKSLRGVVINVDIMESKLLETPDVLQVNNNLEQFNTQQGNILVDFGHVTQVSVENTKESFASCTINDSEPSRTFSGEQPSLLESDPFSLLHPSTKDQTSHIIPDKKEYEGQEAPQFDVSELSTKVLQLEINVEDVDKSSDAKTELREENEIHRIFQELDAKLSESSQFTIPETCIQRWAAEIILALDALHKEGIVCRNLNPNNILLNERGHIQLTYFSRWSEVEDSCDSDAIERMYCAPEIGGIAEETEACDWWSLGALLFELLTRKALAECHPAGINTHTSLNVPESVSKEARSFVQQLLQFNPLERLGARVAGVEDIKSHPFFAGIDWMELTV
ncbi:ribosomal protein S6 kinase delta-1-like [Bombina bombina]|uniref:ribosomal protein S6 kinase delta-1-like n=1 Tax=Bombina bombina TaxID=8345 RepID=UPI00235AE6FE|nr:ribosomal protein S6 kinase delta-1-like [Bombina bombina]